MNVPQINRVLAAIRAGTAWTLDDNDLALIENEDADVWPVPAPNYGEPWLHKYVPRVGTEPGVGWSELTAAIRARGKPVAAPVVIAVQPAPDSVADEADEIIARLRRESEEADEHLRQIEASQAKPSPVAPAKRIPPVAISIAPTPPMLPKGEQPLTCTGKRWSEVVNDLRSLGSNGKLPTRTTFEKWIERNGLDRL